MLEICSSTVQHVLLYAKYIEGLMKPLLGQSTWDVVLLYAILPNLQACIKSSVLLYTIFISLRFTSSLFPLLSSVTKTVAEILQDVAAATTN